MKPKALAQRIRDGLGAEFRSQFHVKLKPGLSRENVVIAPKGRRRDVLKVSHSVYPVLAGQIMPQLRQRDFRAVLPAYSTADKFAPIEIIVYA